jgi:soluble lytic murein transglycosylase-like protein
VAVVCIVVTFVSSTLLSDAAHAERTLSATRRVSGLSIDPFAPSVTEVSKRFTVPERWIPAVMHVESGGKLRARSQKGAMGLMQIMPKIWGGSRARYGLAADAFDSHDNFLTGAASIRELRDLLQHAGFLAAYNADSGRYENYLTTGRASPDVIVCKAVRMDPLTVIRCAQCDHRLTIARRAIRPLADLFVRRASEDRSP